MGVMQRRMAYAKSANLSLEQVERFYAIEKSLAQKLRDSTREERRARNLYTTLYDELFQQVPYHPLLKKKLDPKTRALQVATAVKKVERFLTPEATFLEIGAGDCAVSHEVSKRALKVYAVDVSYEITEGRDRPPNLEVAISDGVSIPVPDGSIDVAYSNHLMEHLHPDDAIDQLQNIYRALAPGGVYVCCTPNRLSGPSDVSRGFDDVASGFHLKEYTPTELYEIFRACGFSSVTLRQGIKQSLSWETPLGTKTVAAFRAFERLLGGVPISLRGAIAKAIFKGGGMTATAYKT